MVSDILPIHFPLKNAGQKVIHIKHFHDINWRNLALGIYSVAHERSYRWLQNNTFLFLQKHLTSGTELFLTGWKTVPNESR